MHEGYFVQSLETCETDNDDNDDDGIDDDDGDGDGGDVGVRWDGLRRLHWQWWWHE